MLPPILLRGSGLLLAWGLGVGLVFSCAADGGHQNPTTPPRDSGRVDTGSVRDTGSPEDVPGLDVPAAVDTGLPIDIPAPDLPVVRDTGAAIDLPVVRDTGFVDTGFRDTNPPARDVDTRPHDTDLVVGGAPSDSAARFGGTPDAARVPTIVYPSAGTILPPNLPSFEVHFRPAAGTDLFRVAFTGDRGTVRIYTRCTAVGGGCVLSLDTAAWDEVWRVSQPGGNVRLDLSATALSGGGVGRAGTLTFGVAHTDLRGGLYYWNASSGVIVRYEFGLAGARPEAFIRGDLINCQGCHALSRDGRRIAMGRFIPGPAWTRVVDVASRRDVTPEFRVNYMTFSPDGARLLASDGARLSLLDPNTGAGLPGLPSGLVGSMPDWSRDGARAVFSRPATVPFLGGTPGHNAPADLVVLPWSGSAFGAATVLVRSARENNYYPSYSPDHRWVLFNRSAGESYHAIDAHLWAVRSDASSPPVRLALADGEGDTGNSWPKWAPFVQTWQGEPLMWLTFSSRRDYGLRLQQSGREPAMRTSQLWMAAFRPDRPGDPSAPAFWLPFQDLRQGNHIAQWSEVVQRQGCSSDGDCAPGESCVFVNVGNACVGR